MGFVRDGFRLRLLRGLLTLKIDFVLRLGLTLWRPPTVPRLLPRRGFVPQRATHMRYPIHLHSLRPF